MPLSFSEIADRIISSRTPKKSIASSLAGGGEDIFQKTEVIPALAAGTERYVAGTIDKFGKFLGEDIKAEIESPTVPILPFPWSPRIKKGKQSKIGKYIDEFMYKFGDKLSEQGTLISNFWDKAASEGWEAPNPAVMFGWKHPWRKTARLAGEAVPGLGIAA